MFLSCIHIFMQCAIVGLIVNSEYIENEREECSKWDSSSVLAVLYNEPAYLQRGCHNESHLFYIALVNTPYGVYRNSIYPCNGIPEEFQINGLSVLVSGNILRDAKWNPCTPNMPNARIAPNNIFELKTIKAVVK